SSIFYYLYKFTPFGKTLRKGKGENIVNIDEEEHNDLLYTEDTEQTPFKKRDYHIAYHIFSDT
ncbi:variable surface protein Vir26, truncated, putative, partial [Plasmodium vivax]